LAAQIRTPESSSWGRDILTIGGPFLRWTARIWRKGGAKFEKETLSLVFAANGRLKSGKTDGR